VCGGGGGGNFLVQIIFTCLRYTERGGGEGGRPLWLKLTPQSYTNSSQLSGA
jgi:hypothetical protein